MKRDLFTLGYKEDDIYQNLDSLSKRIVRENKSPIEKAKDAFPSGMFEKIPLIKI